MKYGSIIIEKKEYVFLKRLLNVSGYAQESETKRSLQKFNEELQHAQIVDEEDMPEDVIRFNSKVTVSSEKGWERTIQIVTPVEKDFSNNKISFLTPMGSALFGYSANDTVIWDFPKGTQQLKIVAVSQEKNTTNRKISI
ncbi:GreA/GreB family elongation factor [Marixanthomonas sp. SCSIO 43207]|uniref:GreA/GreB family elongation factor n=1 Tax=Marixanthomonas sp. SCSIO 43207 TaxID=2779360 RepID=UPI001CAA2B6D|nr:GreA/GreB family elongation factor [Marixanthomonas sp. SCSIO 43207]UAB80105.1 GreA/GreB family elongation factor [Marixanthomonas sp. SCSIO 43207]